MDILQIALVFLIILLSVFLSILGLQVFLILRDLRRDLNKLDRFIRAEIREVHEVEKLPIAEEISKPQTKNTPKVSSISKPRFFKKVLR